MVMTAENWLVLIAAVVIAVVPATHVEYMRAKKRQKQRKPLR